MENDRSRTNHKYMLYTWSTMIGVVLIIVGMVFLVNPDNLRLKVGAGLLLLGVFCIFLLNIDDRGFSQFITGRRLAFFLIVWVFIMLLITYNIDADVFFMIVILGALILMELLSFFMTPPLRKRNTILFYLLIAAFLVVVEQNVVHHLVT